MTYKVQFATRAERQLACLPQSVQVRLVACVERLALEPRPRGAKRLKGNECRWRLRVGDDRIVYEVYDDIVVVLVVAIGHRRDVYRRLI